MLSNLKRVAFAAILSVGLMGTVVAPTPAEAGILRDVLKAGVAGVKGVVAPVKGAAKGVAGKAKGKLQDVAGKVKGKLGQLGQ